MTVIIIPAYQPDDRLPVLIDRLQSYDNKIVVVDDGSGSKSREIFDRIGDAVILCRHEENRGKGAAIKTALHYIDEHLPEAGVICIMDADGQHLVSDAVRLAGEAGKYPDALMLGVRDFSGNIPWRSKAGNLISAFVFRCMTGVRVSDTQTGLRAFHRQLIPELLEIRGERYEYEMNMLMTLAKKGIPIRGVPVSTVYHDSGNSCSHFHPVRDSFRIYKDIFRFALSSFSSFLIDYFLFLLLVLLNPGIQGWLIGANVTARVVSAVYNYHMNCRFVFKCRTGRQSALQYFGLAACILALNNIFLSVFTGPADLAPWLAKLFTECLLFTLSWTVQRFFIFKKDEKTDGGEVSS